MDKEQQIRRNRRFEVAVEGCLAGTAVGDSLGLPYEGLGRGRLSRLLGRRLRHRFLCGRGMISDDTEHACLVAEALLAARGEGAAFELELGRGVARWLRTCPAGLGMASLKAGLRLQFSPAGSGVYSAGNGPCMRAPLLGLLFGGQPHRMKDFVRRSTRITHTDERACLGAFVIALAAHRSLTRHGQCRPDEFLADLQTLLMHERGADEIINIMRRTLRSAERGDTLSVFAETVGCAHAVSGFVYHTVPCVIHVWLRHQRDFEGAMEEVIRAGGDTDTHAAILGGIIGCGTGVDGIPQDWLRGVHDWPRSRSYLQRLASHLVRIEPIAPLAMTKQWLRNAFFCGMVLLHALRRRLPPY